VVENIGCCGFKSHHIDECNPGQVVYILVPLAPKSRISTSQWAVMPYVWEGGSSENNVCHYVAGARGLTRFLVPLLTMFSVIFCTLVCWLVYPYDVYIPITRLSSSYLFQLFQGYVKVTLPERLEAH